MILSLLATSLLLCLFVTGVTPGSPAAAARAETLAEETSPVPAEEATPARGISLRGWWSDPEGPDAPLLQAAWAGMNWVGLEVPAYRPDSLSPVVLAGLEAPSDANLVRAIWAARGLRLKVALKLELEAGPTAPGAEGWNAVLTTPPPPRPAFRDLSDFVAFYADLAEANGVEMVWLGAGLVGGGEPSPQVKQLSAQLRGRYRGPITFRIGPSPSAQPALAALVGWWEALGYTGVVTGQQSVEQVSSSGEPQAEAAAAENGQAMVLSASIHRPVLFTEAGRGEVPATAAALLPDWLAGKPWVAGAFWGRGPVEGQPYPSFLWAGIPSLISAGQPSPAGKPATSSLNGRPLMLNVHGALFHSEPTDLSEDISYARWMGAGVIRAFATDNNSLKDWNGRLVGNRIADAAPVFRANGVKLLVALVNNHRPVPGEAAESSGWMDGYYQLLLPFYQRNWRDAYLPFAQELITTVRDRGALDVIYAWELGNELHTPQDPAAIIPFVVDMVGEIRRLDPTTPILPGTMGANHLQPWRVRSPVARWLYCDAPVDGYTLHAYDWVSKDRQGDMPISWDLDYITVEPCANGRRLPVIVEELGTSRSLPGVYAPDQEWKRLEQEVRQILYALSHPQVVGIGVWNGESPRVADPAFHDDVRGLTSFGIGGRGGGSAYDPRPEGAPGARAHLERLLRNLPALP